VEGGHLPVLREDYPAAGALPPDRQRPRAGPGLLAMVLHGKFGHHLPLNRKRGSGV
jgi:hypothetical protein